MSDIIVNENEKTDLDITDYQYCACQLTYIY